MKIKRLCDLDKQSKIALLVFLVLIVAIMLIFFGITCKQRNLASLQSFTPTEETGFVKNTNELLALLLNDTCSNVHVRCLDDLNRKYPSLEFDVPDMDSYISNSNNDVDIRVVDIRLVGLNESRFDSAKVPETLKNFYKNSDLAKHLDMQRKDLGRPYFKISFSQNSTGSIIKSITVVRTMLRVALDKSLWSGAIAARDNILFPEDNSCFLVWGNNVLPIPLTTNKNDYVRIDCDIAEKKFSLGRKVIKDWLLLSDFLTGGKYIALNFNNEQYFALRYVNDTTIEMKLNSLYCRYTSKDTTNSIRKMSPGEAFQTVHFKDDMKFLFFKDKEQTVKLTEMVLSQKNPLLVLSAEVHSNRGKSRYLAPESMVDAFTYQVVNGLSSMLSAYDFSDTVCLSIDPVLSSYLDKELSVYADSLRKRKRNPVGNGRLEMSLTVMDMATGDILAMPFYRSGDDELDKVVRLSRKNPALIRRYLGSTFKPLLALASVLTVPELNYLDTRGRYAWGYDNNRLFTFLGGKVTPWAIGYPNHWAGRAEMSDFLGYSCDVYPVALAAMALNGSTGRLVPNSRVFETLSNGQIVFKSKVNLGLEPMMGVLSALYSLPDVSDDEFIGDALYKRYVWDSLLYKLSDSISDQFGVDIVSPDPTVLNLQTFYQAPHSLSGTFRPWVLGQGSNEWTSVKLAESWSRMLTKREVKASFVASDRTAVPSLIDKLIANGKSVKSKDTLNNTWNRFLEHFNNAQSKVGIGATLWKMNNKVNDFNRNKNYDDQQKIVLFGKTGTPDKYKRLEYHTLSGNPVSLDMGLYCMGLMRNVSYQQIQNQQIGKGIVCVMRITYVSGENNENVISSSEARDFFLENYRFENIMKLTDSYF